MAWEKHEKLGSYASLNPAFAGDHYSEIVAWLAENPETELEVEDGRMRGRDRWKMYEHSGTSLSCP